MESFDVVGQIMAFEAGELSMPKIVELFKYLIRTGMLRELQGFYGRTAQALREAGLL